jgi:phospholipid/cholesterol/gamma-HCH transport system permease protein
MTGAITDPLARVGEIVLLGVQTLTAIPRPPLEIREILHQIRLQGNRALPLLMLMSAFAGLVMAYQSGLSLARFGAQQYIGQLTVLALTREMMPVLTALVLGGRIAAGVAAELGAMVATEQIAAVRALGADPVKKLVMPRVVASIVVLPAFTVLGDVIGSLGGMLVAHFELNVPATSYLSSVRDTIQIADFLSGVVKSTIFGLVGAVIACHAGLATRGGTAGVGRATTAAVVQSSLTIVVLDFFLARAMAPWLA